MVKRIEIFTDGACSGNPGAAGLGFVIRDNGKIIKEFSKDIGTATNNIAEYMAVIYALQEALILRADEVILNTDSELLYNQLKGDYKVKHVNIKPLFEQVKHLTTGFRRFEIRHILRAKNKNADRLAKKAIKREQAKVVALEFNFGEESPSFKG